MLPSCGAVVLFSGTVRDYAVDDQGVVRDAVQHLVYEAYEAHVEASFRKIADEVRGRWPETGRIAVLHRTSIGVSVITFYGILWLLGANDEISANFHISLFALSIFGRFAIFLGPALAYLITYRICLGLQRSDVEVLAHGVESGVIVRSPEGGYSEIHTAPAEDIAEHLRGKKPIPMLPAEADGEGIPPKGLRGPLGRIRAKMSRTYGTDHIPLPEGNGHADGHGEEHAAVGAGEEQKQLH